MKSAFYTIEYTWDKNLDKDWDAYPNGFPESKFNSLKEAKEQLNKLSKIYGLESVKSINLRIIKYTPSVVFNFAHQKS